jgi:hypothetical protein
MRQVPGVDVLFGVTAKNLKTSLAIALNSQKVLKVSFEDDRHTHPDPA